MGKRDPGIIRSASVDTSHIQTVWVQVDYDGGGTQGFGGLALQEPGILRAYVADLCDAFGVQDLKDLVGQRCHALKCWGGHQESIEGLESAETGQRFTHTGWRRARGLDFPTPLEQRRESLRQVNLEALKRASAAMHEMQDLEKGYTDWSQEPEARELTWWERLVR